MAARQLTAASICASGAVFGSADCATSRNKSGLAHNISSRSVLRSSQKIPVSEASGLPLSLSGVRPHRLTPRVAFTDNGHSEYYEQCRKKSDVRGENKSRKQAAKGQRQAAKAKGALLSAELATTLESLQTWKEHGTHSGLAQVGDLEEVVRKLETLGAELMQLDRQAKDADKTSSSSSSSSESSDSEAEKEEKRRRKQAKMDMKLAKKFGRREEAAASASETLPAMGTLQAEMMAGSATGPATETSRRTLEALFGSVGPLSTISILPPAVASSIGSHMDDNRDSASLAFLDMPAVSGRDVQASAKAAARVVALGSSVLAHPHPAARIEVCTGSKCRKEGAQQILAALQDRLPLGSAAEAVACKCMGKCKTAPNMKFRREGCGSVLEASMSVGEVDHLLVKHFGVVERAICAGAVSLRRDPAVVRELVGTRS